MSLVRISSSALFFVVEHENDIVPMRERVKRFSAAAGLSREASWAMAIAVSEAATNILKYANRGTIGISIEEQPERCVLFEAVDEGAGIENLDEAIRDRVSRGMDLSLLQEAPASRTGLGLGLGAIQRLMDGSSFENRPEGGFRVTGFRRIPDPKHR